MDEKNAIPAAPSAPQTGAQAAVAPPGNANGGMEYLEFEQPIAELEYKLLELRWMSNSGNATGRTGIDLDRDIESLEKKCEKLRHNIYSNLSP